MNSRLQGLGSKLDSPTTEHEGQLARVGSTTVVGDWLPRSTFSHIQVNKDALEQHIAVFGESGSGTTMVSSFYGATQEPQFLKSSLFDVTADDTGQGHRLHANYLGMKDSGRRPETTRIQPPRTRSQ